MKVVDTSGLQLPRPLSKEALPFHPMCRLFCILHLGNGEPEFMRRNHLVSLLLFA